VCLQQSFQAAIIRCTCSARLVSTVVTPVNWATWPTVWLIVYQTANGVWLTDHVPPG